MAGGQGEFLRLLFRRDWPHFVAFDLLSLKGKDLRQRPLLERKRQLKEIMPRINSRLIYLDHLSGRGMELFERVCRKDLEGVACCCWHRPTHSRNL